MEEGSIYPLALAFHWSRVILPVLLHIFPHFLGAHVCMLVCSMGKKGETHFTNPRKYGGTCIKPAETYANWSPEQWQEEHVELERCEMLNKRILIQRHHENLNRVIYLILG